MSWSHGWKQRAIRWLEDNRGLVIVVFCLPASFVSFSSGASSFSVIYLIGESLSHLAKLDKVTDHLLF